jgi:hypothetical protein
MSCDMPKSMFFSLLKSKENVAMLEMEMIFFNSGGALF